MSFQFKCEAKTTYLSHMKYIWLDKQTWQYFITDDQPELIPNPNYKDETYMIIKTEPQQPRFSQKLTKTKLDHVIKQLTPADLLSSSVDINGTIWKYSPILLIVA